MRVKLCFIAKAGRRSRTWLGETGNQKRNRLRDSPFLAKVHTWRRSYRSILPLSLRMGTLSDHENSQAPPTWAAGMEVSMSLVGGITLGGRRIFTGNLCTGGIVKVRKLYLSIAKVRPAVLQPHSLPTHKHTTPQCNDWHSGIYIYRCVTGTVLPASASCKPACNTHMQHQRHILLKRRIPDWEEFGAVWGNLGGPSLLNITANRFRIL